ncbi:hypothetical protein EI94DRAFT_1688993 [Lactarius quietus]|nr:hypothetical protein EI94DRAFT_1688993 [Lactarius quietus]
MKARAANFGRSLPGRAISCHRQPESVDALISLSSERKLSVLQTVMAPSSVGKTSIHPSRLYESVTSSRTVQYITLFL